MAKVKVWRYKVFFNHHGAIDSGRYGTQSAIQSLGGMPIEGSGTTIEDTLLDDLGRAPVGFDPAVL